MITRFCPLIWAFILLLSVLRPVPGLAQSVDFDISGVSGEMLRNVQAVIALPAGMGSNGDLDSRWVDRHLKGLPVKIAAALQPFGYYSPEIRVVPQSGSGPGRRILIHIEPGDPVLLDLVWVELQGPGRDDPLLREKLWPFTLNPGDILDHSLYEQGKSELQNRALDLGYLRADYSRHEILVQRQSREARLYLVLQTGGRYRVGQIDIQGAQEYPPWFLRRFLTLKPGQVFTYERLGRTQRNFYDADRFRSVRVRPSQELGEALQVPLTVELESSPTRRLRPGIGYGTDTGARLSLTYQDLNHWRAGNELASNLELSQVRQSVGSSYILPSRKRADASVRLQLSLEQEELDAYENRLLIAEIEYQRSLGRREQGSIFLRYHREDYRVEGPREHSLLLLGGLRYSVVRFDDPLRPRGGWQASAELRGAHPELGSDSALLQVLGKANLLVALPWRSSFLLRLQGATTLQEDGLEDIPASLRFFAGGDRSVRGYSYQSIGHRNSQGELEGGKHLALGNFELERSLGPDWALALFYDMGSAFNNLSSPSWFRSAGLSLRRYTQIGPVSASLARQLRVENPSWRLHLSVGFAW